MRGLTFLVCLAVTASAMSDQSIETARAAYAEGRFIEASELAEALKTSAGFALAALSIEKPKADPIKSER